MRAGLALGIFLKGLGIGRERFRSWRERYGKVNEHNGFVPRDHELLPEERALIVKYYEANSLEGYRRLTYLMIDADIVYVSPSTTYRVLRAAGVLGAKNRLKSKKGRGFKHPGAAHRHWHIDITYIKIKGVFYYLILVLDGYSRFIVAWDLRDKMAEADVEIVVQKGREAFPGATPRVISDNGSQFISKEFKLFISQVGMTHVKTSVRYPQSNGKLERCNKTIKQYLRTMYIADFADGLRLIGQFIKYYNYERLHSAIGYLSPADRLNGRDKIIFEQREQKLESARQRRRLLREKPINHSVTA